MGRTGGANLQTVAQFAILAVACAMYARSLPRRERFGVRAAVALGLWVGGAALAIVGGYTLYPTLTDNLSFFVAIGIFALVLVALTVGVLALWEASPWTALFCASSAYLVQSVAFGLNRVVHMVVSANLGEMPWPLAAEAVSLAACSVATLWAVWRLLARRLAREGLLGIRNRVMLFAVVVAMAVTLVFDLAVKDVMVYEIPLRYSFVFSLTHVVVCSFVLVAEFEVIYNERLRADVAALGRTMDEQARQFDLSRRTIEAIDRRCHDIRHHVVGLLAGNGDKPPTREQLAQVARAVNVYDAATRTGNAALDVVLTERGLLCQEEQIRLGCIADGSAVAFMDPADLYALVGTALDEAIEAERAVADPARRSISLSVRSQVGMASVGVRSYRERPVAIRDGLPAAGGVAAETVRGVVGRYGGTVVYSMAGDALSVDMLIPSGGAG